MPRFIVNNPNDLNFPYQASKFLLNLIVEKISGRVGKEEGSFNWKNNEDFEFSFDQLESAVPTHGNFAGPGYSCGKRGEFRPDQIKNYPVAEILDPKLGKMRPDYVDILAKDHDLAYATARGKPDYWEQIRKADMKLVTETQKLLDGTSPLFSNGGKMTPGETAYAASMLDLFKMTIAMRDEPLAAFEKLKNAGYGADVVNGVLGTLSNGLQFMNPRDLLRKLHFSENEIQEINQKIAEYCEQNNLDAGSILTASAADAELSTREIASVASAYPDEYADEDQDYYRGPGMGMG